MATKAGSKKTTARETASSSRNGLGRKAEVWRRWNSRGGGESDGVRAAVGDCRDCHGRRCGSESVAMLEEGTRSAMWLKRREDARADEAGSEHEVRRMMSPTKLFPTNINIKSNG